MRFMMFMLPNIPDEQWGPPPEAVTAMERYNQEMDKAGILLEREGLHPPSTGARVSFPEGRATVLDGPFAEAKEVIGGFWMIDVPSREEAIEWASRCPIGGAGPEIEVRQVFEPSDFAPEVQEAFARAREGAEG